MTVSEGQNPHSKQIHARCKLGGELQSAVCRVRLVQAYQVHVPFRLAHGDNHRMGQAGSIWIWDQGPAEHKKAHLEDDVHIMASQDMKVKAVWEGSCPTTQSSQHLLRFLWKPGDSLSTLQMHQAAKLQDRHMRQLALRNLMACCRLHTFEHIDEPRLAGFWSSWTCRSFVMQTPGHDLTIFFAAN